jgi:hypothetical protein
MIMEKRKKKKMNCWEFKNCGRQPGGSNVDELGVCPAAADTSSDGKNDGKNAGRCCWRIAGTFCDGKVQGTWASKIENCANCDFFKKVQLEEGDNFEV